MTPVWLSALLTPPRFWSLTSTGRNRSKRELNDLFADTWSSVRISSCGIVDVITFSANSPPDANLFQYQQEDLVGLGRLMMALATLNLAAANNVGKSLDTMGKLYGNDIKNAVWWLVGNKSHPGTKVNNAVMRLVRIVDGMRYRLSAMYSS